MADEALRMQAEVQDWFSGPLKALRSQLLDTARTGENHGDTLAKGFNGVEGAMQSTARTASSVVNPAFAALGFTGLSAGAAVAGISAALNRLTGSMASLGQLSRETGLAARTLYEFGSVAGRFGIEQDAVASTIKNFAAQMRTCSIGTGEAFRWVMQQGRDASGRTPRLLRPNSMGGAPGMTMDQAAAMREGRADGAGWAAREASRKTFEAQQAEANGLRASGAQVATAASRAGVVAMPQIENNGSVVVNVHKPGPETRVATTASGKLFQDMVQRSGAQMRRAD